MMSKPLYMPTCVPVGTVKLAFRTAVPLPTAFRRALLDRSPPVKSAAAAAALRQRHQHTLAAAAEITISTTTTITQTEAAPSDVSRFPVAGSGSVGEPVGLATGAAVGTEVDGALLGALDVGALLGALDVGTAVGAVVGA